MFGLGFIVRLVIALLSIIAFITAVVLIAQLLAFIARFAWDRIEDTFYDQARWMADKFEFLKPWRLFTVPVITIILVLCCLCSLIYVIYVGSGLEGATIQ